MPVQQSSYAVGRADLGEAIREFHPEGMDLIADKVLPIREVKKKAGTLSVIQRENMKIEDDSHANGTAFNRINLSTEDMEYACKDRGLEGLVTDEDRENYASDYDVEEETVQAVRTKMLLRREIRTKDLIFNTTTFTGASLYTDYSGAPWDAAGSDIIAHVMASMEKVRLNTGMKPNALIVGAAAMQNIIKNTGIRACFAASTIVTRALIEAAMAAIFGLERLIVGGATYDGADEGQAFSGADIWGDDYAMVARINNGPTNSGGLGRILVWDAMDTINDVKEYREEQTESYVYKIREFSIEKIFCTYFGHLMGIDA